MNHADHLSQKECAAATGATAQAAALSRRYGGTFYFAVEKVAHQIGNFLPVRLQSEVPGVYEVIFEILKVPFVRFCACRREDFVIFSPDDQRWWLTVQARLPIPCPASSQQSGHVALPQYLQMTIA